MTAVKEDTAYASLFQGGTAVEQYRLKLSGRIDRLRHAREVGILSRYARDALFDCTIGTGRFIGQLPQVTSYAGMDLSAEFVAYVRERYPGTEAHQGDLTQGISQPDAAFDSVMCLRSLSAIGRLRSVLAEMLRIARPGGTLIIDYGRKPQITEIAGQRVEIDNEPLDDILAALDATEVERIHLDAILTRLKRTFPLAKLLDSRPANCLPDSILLRVDEVFGPRLWERQIIVLRKEFPAA